LDARSIPISFPARNRLIVVWQTPVSFASWFADSPLATIAALHPPEPQPSPAEEMREAFWALKRRRIHVSAAHVSRASSIGTPCERRLFYDRTAGELARPYSPELQAIFDLGKELEGYVIHELEAMGCEVTQRERDYLDRDLEIGGHADSRVCRPGWPRPLTAEIKGLNTHTAESIETIADIRDSRQTWVRKYYDQLQTYLMFDGAPAGVFVLLNKGSGQITFVDCPRDDERIDAIKAKAARIRDAVRANEPPPRLQSDDCGRCPFEHVCMPDRLAGEGTQILDGEAAVEAELLIAKRLELAVAHSEFEAVDRQLKKMLPGTSELLVGRFIVQARQVARKGFVVEPTTYWQRRYAAFDNGGAEPSKDETK